ncbi:hypothetical protein, partial [Streptomyces olivaceus]|uniref:hypothetical protein n=1 Tax=Streptomyces olivaceus TaxID=47716 RepID=UPI00365F9F30
AHDAPDRPEFGRFLSPAVRRTGRRAAPRTHHRPATGRARPRARRSARPLLTAARRLPPPSPSTSASPVTPE